MYKDTMEDWDWPSIRQSVAERVLSRHLEDQQEVALGPRQRGKHPHRHRDRAGSLFVKADAADVMVRPMTRRHSVPAVSPAETGLGDYDKRHGRDHVLGSRASHRSSNEDSPLARLAKTFDKLETPPRTAQSGLASPNLVLDAMKSTLQTEQMMEEQRKNFIHNRPVVKQEQQYSNHTHHKHHAAVKSQRSTGGDDDAVLLREAGGSKQRHTAAVRRISAEESHIHKLEREETFINTGTFQLLSLRGERPEPDAAVAEDSSEAVSDTRPQEPNSNGGNERTTGQHKHLKKVASPKRRASNSQTVDKTSGLECDVPASERFAEGDVQAQAAAEIVTEPRGSRQSRRGRVEVDFFDEDKGLHPVKKQDNCPLDPIYLTLPLHLLNDNDADVKNEKGDEEKSETALVEEDREDEAWEQARQCHYIRGYDPPDMRMPKDFVGYVFDQ